MQKGIKDSVLGEYIQQFYLSLKSVQVYYLRSQELLYGLLVISFLCLCLRLEVSA